jgi:hypothetical protein
MNGHKRRYTMSALALRARQKNSKKARAKATGPRTQEGKKASSRNSWKHGLRASSNTSAPSFCSAVTRPCLTTCTKYPCDVVKDGDTGPGQDCLDGKFMTIAYKALIKGIKEKKYDDINDLIAIEIASNLLIVRRLKDEILEKGVLLEVEKVDKDGNVISRELRLNPLLLPLPKLIADLGLTLPEAILTPRAKAKLETEQEGVGTLADILSKIGSRMRKRDDLETVETKQISDED